MSLKPLEFDRRYGELDHVFSAYVGQLADDTTEQTSPALTAYLRHTWHSRPWALAVAEQQLREYAAHPPGRLRQRLGEFYPLPDTGVPDAEVEEWLLTVAGHIRRSVEEGDVPPPSSAPATHWEWHARFPELAQFLGGWFSQDMPDEFGDHDAAIDDYADTTDRTLVARLVGELRELVALSLDEQDYVIGTAELGIEVGPPKQNLMGNWLTHIANRLSVDRPEYGGPDLPA